METWRNSASLKGVPKLIRAEGFVFRTAEVEGAVPKAASKQPKGHRVAVYTTVVDLDVNIPAVASLTREEGTVLLMVAVEGVNSLSAQTRPKDRKDCASVMVVARSADTSKAIKSVKSETWEAGIASRMVEENDASTPIVTSRHRDRPISVLLTAEGVGVKNRDVIKHQQEPHDIASATEVGEDVKRLDATNMSLAKAYVPSTEAVKSVA